MKLVVETHAANIKLLHIVYHPKNLNVFSLKKKSLPVSED